MFACTKRVGTVLPSRPARRVRPGRRCLHVQAMWGKDKEGGGGSFGGIGNLMENMKQAQQLVQGEAGRIQKELSASAFEGYDEEEFVKVTFMGDQRPISIEFAEGALDCEVSVLESRITDAMQDAHQKSVAGMREKMTELAKKLGLPADANFGKL